MKNKSSFVWITMIMVVIVAGFLLVRNNREFRELKEETSNNTSTITSPSDKTYTIAQLSTHNNKSDCWLAIEGSVYDVTKFIDQHPGGEEILKGCGKDATSLFNSVPNHADEGRELLPSYFIGKLQ